MAASQKRRNPREPGQPKRSSRADKPYNEIPDHNFDRLGLITRNVAPPDLPS